MKFTRAIVRQPASSIINGLTTSSQLGAVDYQNALIQHQHYIEALKTCGLEVTCLPPLEYFADACFVEDPAIVTADFAVCTRPGAPSRLDEVNFIEPTLKQFFGDNVYHINDPGLLDGGDILQIERHFYIGLSNRTNQAGAEQLMAILAQHNYQSTLVSFGNMLHLKTGVSYIADETLLIQQQLAKLDTFKAYKKIIVAETEAYAANSIMVNNTMLIPAGFDQTIKAVEQAGYKVLPVDTSEFQKIDGGLSCLSLRF